MMIRILRANVSREAALAELEPGGLRRLVGPPLRKLAEIYIPFRLYRVVVTNAERREEKMFAVDGVRGNLDVFEFESAPETDEIASKNTIPAGMSLEKSAEAASDYVRRIVFKKGFFKVKELKIEPELVAEFHYPYWVGFYGAGEMVTLEVLDAVRRRKEGAKVRELVREWLGAEAAEGQQSSANRSG